MMPKDTEVKTKTYKIYDQEYSNLKEPKISDKDYLFYQGMRTSRQNIAAFAAMVEDRSSEYDIYFMTSVFEDISQNIRVDEDCIKNFLEYIPIKIGSILCKNPKDCIVELFMFPEESFHQTKRYTNAMPHFHGALFIKKSFNERFKEKCVIGIRQVETRMSLRETYDLLPKILTPDSPLRIKDCRIHPITSGEEFAKCIKYSGKRLGNSAYKFRWDDAIFAGWGKAAETLPKLPVVIARASQSCETPPKEENIEMPAAATPPEPVPEQVAIIVDSNQELEDSSYFLYFSRHLLTLSKRISTLLPVFMILISSFLRRL